jgi:hypothetical protein
MEHVKKFNKWLNESGYWQDIESEGEPGWEEHRERAMQHSQEEEGDDLQSEGSDEELERIETALDDDAIASTLKKHEDLKDSAIAHLKKKYGERADEIISKIESL